ncbi:hypothetical protein M5F03_14915 [Acinetobacter sp. ANC 5579]|uniref:Uncharacterized protein n=1 Tax=Acinetobacter chengduensis TaxID=2420890 RepID=A0ABX9TUU5_9GAMM|nr:MULTISPECIES: hypothetical protein [Acinetobacter]MCL6233159.1 hypothetical protein [Acinetobacter amyesii]MCL6236423.1 hypothetical protein [Acinetobacter amyesii]MCL6241824.1 hypothetical protein [Acinetobacter amyesii]RLL20172.1 hypothetical protein D9K81_12760 [Acinetobacter chengduensis]
MRHNYIDHCIQQALKGNIVHLYNNLYFLSAETALNQVLIPEHICCKAPYWIIGYELPRPIKNKQELKSLFTWHNFFSEFASNADEFKDFNPRDE